MSEIFFIAINCLFEQKWNIGIHSTQILLF